jgi:aspartate/methionine/tyrosine aminotransferase
MPSIRFSARLPADVAPNAISRAAATARARGTPIFDLTESNPTVVDLPYPDGLLASLADPRSLRYAPAAAGLRTAREAVAADFARRQVAVDPDHLVLSASTSEAYSWLFKLLCEPGDAVLVPRPSYPLFEHLTRLEGVRTVAYDLHYHGRWELDLAALARAPEDVRAVVVVSPNNPTGSFVSRGELDALVRICRERGWAIVADEVFAEYGLDAECPVTDIAGQSDVLSFTLGGASKLLGLPQVNLAWIWVGGAGALRDDALGALEIVADTFLSVGAPVQVAAPSLFHDGARVRTAIQARTRANLGSLRGLVQRYPSCTAPTVEGGWCAVVRVPATRSEEALVLELLEREQVLVHPGYFFDFAHEAFVVVSLLPREEVFVEGCRRLLAYATSGDGRP